MARTKIELDVQPLTGALGAEVRGVDLRHLDDDTWDQIHETWLEHLVLFFPDQRLTPDDHVALGQRFGELEVHPYLVKRPEHEEIVVIRTLGHETNFWHTDVTFSPTPPTASILRMAQPAGCGGDTLFTNQYLVFEQLSAPMRAFVEGLTAVHTAALFGHPEIQAEHPVVRVHPETGRRSLFVNRGFTAYISQLRPGESDALLAYLFGWSEQPRFQCRYRWQLDAVGIWDNRCTQHNAVGDFTGERAIERVTVIGDAPVGGAGSPWAAFEPHMAEAAVSHGGFARASAPQPLRRVELS